MEVAYGGDPAVVSYQQTEMRKHLVSCFDKGELQLLPRANKAASVCSREILILKMYCCGLPVIALCLSVSIASSGIISDVLE